MLPTRASHTPRDRAAGAGYDAAPMSGSHEGRRPRSPVRLAAARAALAASAALAALAAAILAAGCGPGAGASCHSDADCPGGTCGISGVCTPPPADGGAGADGGSAGDGGVVADGGTPGDGGTATCTPTHDGTITRSEVTFRAGLSATFRIATNATVDTAGTYDASGTRHWNLATDLAGDHDVTKTLVDPTGTWWAASFPKATYAGRLRDGQDLFGVFEATGSALELLGVVSKDGGATRTLLTYHPAIDVLDFPLSKGHAWRTDATVTGLAQGVAAYYAESWVNRVDDTGVLDTPYGTFDVLRVRIETTQTVGAVITKTESFLFASECFGTVASIFSEPDETAAEFTKAAEVDRLAP